MRPLKLLAPVALAAVLSAGITGQPASATSGDVAGTWTSIDHDGSNQTLDVMGSGNNVYAISLFDDSATSACDGAPAKLVGTGVLDGEELSMRGTVVCLPGGNQFRFRIDFGFEYDAQADTLTDVTGVVWHRS
jgi:hypothetical protein